MEWRKIIYKFPYCEKKDFDKAEKKYLAVESTLCEKKVSISTTTTQII
jgi:hypothetical protein